MKILYIATAIRLDISHGGATHAVEVANGLAALGHELWVIGRGTREQMHGKFSAHVTPTSMPPTLAWMTTPLISRITDQWQPDVIMERFYTFAGGGMGVAHARNIPAVLEVNAPVIDPPQTRKDTLDRLLGRPMARWATQQCRWADRIVTPLATTVPHAVQHKVVPLPWGANVHRFDPERYPRNGTEALALRRRIGIPPDAPVVGFVGSFRAWHGARDAVHAFRYVREQVPNAWLLMVGDGPERQAIMTEVEHQHRTNVCFVGGVPYDDVPAYLAICDVAVAPFAPRMHPPLQHYGFYWSPLKIFEAMAMRVPVVTTEVAPLPAIIEGSGIVVPEGDVPRFAAAITQLLTDSTMRTAMGLRARQRVIEQFSWDAHCRSLDLMLKALVA